MAIGRHLGAGEQGCVHEVEDSEQVVKLTPITPTSDNEAQLCHWLATNGSPTKHLPAVLGVWAWKSDQPGESIYLIHRENLIDVALEDPWIFKLAVVGLENRFYHPAVTARMRDDTVKSVLRDCSEEDHWVVRQLVKCLEETVKTPVRLHDLHGDNLGLRVDGTIVVRDLGSSRLLPEEAWVVPRLEEQP